MVRRLELLAGGKKVPLNKFTRQIITDTMLGMLKNLKDFDNEEEIVLRLHPARSAQNARSEAAEGPETAEGTAGTER